jgi:hypothetical protein
MRGPFKMKMNRDFLWLFIFCFTNKGSGCVRRQETNTGGYNSPTHTMREGQWGDLRRVEKVGYGPLGSNV